jgi:hypothetical protein
MKFSLSNLFFYFLLLLFAGLIVYLIFGHSFKKLSETEIQIIENPVSDHRSIDAPTDAQTVAEYILQNHQLPDYYITKSEARKLGWEPRKGNLCEVLPGRAIGGDRFSNRERKLPQKKGRVYFEADVDYHCGRRNAHRLIYSNDGLVFITRNHYKTFQQLQ